jgi:hypothetical protein
MDSPPHFRPQAELQVRQAAPQAALVAKLIRLLRQPSPVVVVPVGLMVAMVTTESLQ